MSGNEHDAIESLEHLGLSNYEARVFVALQKLGTGTAREIHQVAEVPRSQVYGAAEELGERGLVEIQQATPKRYRPVSLETARDRLAARLEREQEQAFDYLSTIQRERRGDETREDVWTIRGSDSVDDRIVELIEQASEYVIFGTASTDLVTDETVAALRGRAEAGADVRVLSENPDVRALFADEPVSVFGPPSEKPHGPFSGRMILVDDDTLLMSVLADSGLPGVSEETAIWSSETAMAAVLTQTARNGIMNVAERFGLGDEDETA